MTESLLDILKRENRAICKEQICGEELMAERAKADPDEEYCDFCIERRDKALQELDQARKDLKAYLEFVIRY